MPTYKLRGIDVDFPFEAYDCQLVYMEKVIQSLQNKSNALLESPTGTGKTLCLLCATLAWRKSLGAFTRGIKNDGDLSQPLSQSKSSKLPTIVYTSRTHSQIRQVIQELKRTTYRPKMTVLGSREQLCIHDDVSVLRGKAQTNACHALCRKRSKRYCAHYSRAGDFLKSTPHFGEEPIDIEDLMNIGKSRGPCPYYLSRDLHKVSDIIFAPYNYLIDRSYRKTLTIEWDNSILIFDEAHNLEGLCADAASFDLSSGLLTACISEAKKCVDLSIGRRDDSSDKTCNPDNFAILRALLLKLEKRIEEVPIASKELGFTKPGNYIYELLGELNIKQKTATMLIDIIEEASVLLEEGTQAGGGQAKGSVCRLETMGDILKLIFRDDANAHAKYYQVHVQEVQGSFADSFKGKSRTLSWWCFNPGIAMEEFSKFGVGSIILTSGTLSPMDSFAEELKLDFPIRLENPHVISANQIWAGVVPVGPSGYSFNSSYRSRDSVEYKQDLGNAIVNFARIVPDGLLVFFPSYYLLDRCIEFWKTMAQSTSNTIWERICRYKLPVVEPRQSSLFLTAIEDYMSKLKDRSTSGAIFFAVCRGKVSEGLDFADHAGRAVIVTGIPFATRTDPKVRLKREFLDQQIQSKSNQCKMLTGEEWYSQQASRAVNQAVGRVIRHRHDYGAIIFCDERFTSPSRQSQISRWIQPHVKCYSKFGETVFALTRFYRDGGNHGPTKLELTGSGNQAEESENSQPSDKSLCKQLLASSQPSDKSLCGKLLAPMAREESQLFQMESKSSNSQIKKRKLSSHLDEIVPANLSRLVTDKLSGNPSWSHPANRLQNEKFLKHPAGTNLQSSLSKGISLQKHSMMEDTIGDFSRPGSITSMKKPRLGPAVLEWSQECSSTSKRTHLENIHSEAHVKSLPSVCLKIENPQENDKERDKKRVTEIKHNANSDPTSCNDDQKKGTDFLIQVREKLTDAEYEDFVGFMKALKTNAMKIGHVLQSIAKIFSLPDRMHLLFRFKNYVPAKYHSLYDQYVTKSSRAVKSEDPGKSTS
ncbi:DNA helicase [Lithospermum erythrorhizon]|uniref:Regulator of telomere elongation helicase 1 homolog n=1 Tax=Lithospermum erythrorhizon TaxID=34254 RepID=A0AAV3QPX5_LITER